MVQLLHYWPFAGHFRDGSMCPRTSPRARVLVFVGETQNDSVFVILLKVRDGNHFQLGVMYLLGVL